nr:hypothetical protein CFP56_42948 [Quercus suber]
MVVTRKKSGQQSTVNATTKKGHTDLEKARMNQTYVQGSFSKTEKMGWAKEPTNFNVADAETSKTYVQVGPNLVGCSSSVPVPSFQTSPSVRGKKALVHSKSGDQLEGQSSGETGVSDCQIQSKAFATEEVVC